MCVRLSGSTRHPVEARSRPRSRNRSTRRVCISLAIAPGTALTTTTTITITTAFKNNTNKPLPAPYPLPFKRDVGHTRFCLYTNPSNVCCFFFAGFQPTQVKRKASSHFACLFPALPVGSGLNRLPEITTLHSGCNKTVQKWKSFRTVCVCVFV